MKKVAIIGYGYVGKAMGLIFPDALIYDPFYDKSNTKEEINKECGLVVICVPTPPVGMKGEQRVEEDEESFRAVDLSMVENSLEWLTVDLVLIKSTIPPGTTDMLIEKYNKKICFSAEYIGEGNYYTPPKYPDPLDPRKHDFMIIGGDPLVADEIFSYFIPKLGPAKKYHKMTAVEGECVKYFENSWGAMKVTFFNELFEICKAVGASFTSVREGLLLDSRIEQMHTAVFEDKRGFGGKCFPKDLLGIIAQSEKAGYSPDLLKEVWNSNKRFLSKNKENK